MLSAVLTFSGPIKKLCMTLGAFNLLFTYQICCLSSSSYLQVSPPSHSDLSRRSLAALMMSLHVFSSSFSSSFSYCVMEVLPPHCRCPADGCHSSTLALIPVFAGSAADSFFPQPWANNGNMIYWVSLVF